MNAKCLTLLFCCLLVIFFSGCTNIIATQGVDNMLPQDIALDKSVVEWNIEDWGVKIDVESESPFKGFVVDDKLALAIGNAVIEALFGEDFIDKTRPNVYEIKGENMFIIERVYKEPDIIGGDVCVAISKTNGKILKIWGGE